ncbi:MAG: Zn-ribbon OB-fold protein [Frankiales bacterium]|jgi:uncharacterized OB-fold protein|nr:Zn-ribbon OB-fold protein [Frankiales bacterium]
MSSGLPLGVPKRQPETEHFWNATAQGRLLLPRCDDCDSVFWYPRGICPFCSSLRLSWVEASGRGRIYSWTWNTRGEGDFSGVGPYAIGYVELEEGPRLMTNFIDVEPSQLAVDLPVTVVFEDTGEGSSLLRFRPA